MTRLRGHAFVVGVTGSDRLFVDRAADALRQGVLDRFEIDEFRGLVYLIDHTRPVEAGSVLEGGLGVRVARICNQRPKTDPDPPKGRRRQRNDVPDMAICLRSQVVPGTDNQRCADLEILDDRRGRSLGCNARVKRASEAIDFPDQLSDRDLDQGALWTTLKTCQILLKNDDEASLGPESVRMADPCVYDMRSG